MTQTEGTVFVQTTLKILILWHLKDKTRRFGELKRLMPEITEKMLIQQLRELETDEIIQRKVYLEVLPKVEYSFAEYGRTLEPVLQVLCNWGEAHLLRFKQVD